jgi:transcriptional regulator of heat shock response
LTVSAQKRDSLTETELDLVREAQQIDLRMKIFVQIIDRRFTLVENPNATQTNKEEEKFGELPKGTKAQYLHDIERLLDESINNIDDTAVHDAKNKLLPKAMKILVEGCQRYLPKLQLLEEKADKTETVSVSGAIEHCGEIIEAGSKFPEAEPAKKTT